MIKYKINFVINTEIMAINEDKAKRIFLRGLHRCIEHEDCIFNLKYYPIKKKTSLKEGYYIFINIVLQHKLLYLCEINPNSKGFVFNWHRRYLL